MLEVFFYISAGLTITLALGLYITNVVFSFYYKTYELDKNKAISYIQDTLNSKLIYEFNPRDKCLEGEEKLSLGTWDGSIDKCKCGNKEPTPNACTAEQKDCQTLKGQEAKNYTVFNQKEICVKKEGSTYLDLIKSGQIISKDTECPKGKEKECGIVDTFNRKLCVKTDEKCPVNISRLNQSFEITNQNQIQENNFLNEENTLEKIISVIKLSDGFPCLNPSEKKWDAYHPEEKVKYQRCSSYNGISTDHRYEKLVYFNTNKYELYKDNDLLNYKTDELLKDNSTIYLYGATFLGFNVDEDEGFDYEKIISIQDLSNDCAKVMHVLSIIMLAVLGSPLLGGVGAATGSGEAAGYCALFFLAVAGVIIAISFLIDFILCIIIYISVQRIKWRLEDLANLGDNFIKVIINEVIENYSSNYSYSLSIIIVLVLFVCFGVSFIILLVKKRDD